MIVLSVEIDIICLNSMEITFNVIEKNAFNSLINFKSQDANCY